RTGEANFGAVHEWLERSSCDLDDARPSLFVSVSKRSPQRAEPREVANQIFLWKSARHVDRPHVDVGPAALLQNAAHGILIGEGELPGLIGAPRRNAGQEGRGGALGHHHEWVFGWAAPREESQSRSALRRPLQVRKCAN